MANKVEILLLAKDQASGPLKDVSGALGGVGKAAVGLAGGALVGLGAGMAAVGAQGVRMAASLEAQMSGVQAVLGASAREMAGLNELTMQLSINPNLKVDAVGAAQAIEMLARNGLKADEIMAGAAESTVLLANATGGDFAMSADIATDAMALWGIEAENMGEAVNGIVSVVNNSKFSIQDYQLALAQGGGVAASVGMEFRDFNATIAAISPLFASGSDAGTSLKVMMQRLVPATDRASDMMRELGLITAEFEDGSGKLTNHFFDQNGQMKDMVEIQRLLSEATAHLSEEQKNQAFSTIFGTDAMRAAFGLTNLTNEEFRALQATMAQTDAVEGAATRMDNLAGAMEILGGIVDAFQIQIGQALLPVVRVFVEQLAIWAEQYGPMVVAGTAQMVAGLIAFAATVAAGWQALQPLVATFQTLVAGGVHPFSAALAMLTAQFPQLLPLVSLGAALFEQLLAAFAPLAARMQGAWPALQAAVAAAWATLQPLLAEFGARVGEMASLFHLLVTSGVNPFSAALAILAAQFPALLPVLGMGRALFEGLQTVFQTLAASWQAHWPLMQAVAATAWTVLAALIQAAIAVIWPAVQTFLQGLGAGLSEMGPLLAAFGALWQTLQPVVMAVLAVLGAAFVALLAAVVGVFNGIAAAAAPFVAMVAGVMRGLVTTLDGLIQTISGFLRVMVANFTGNSEAARAAWQDMADGLVKIGAGLVTTITSLIGGLVETVMAFIGGLVEGVIGFFEHLFDVLVGNSIIPDMAEAIIRVIEQMAADFLGIFGELVGKAIAKARELADGIIQGIVAGIKSGAGSIIAALGGVLDGALEAGMSKLKINSPSRLFADEIGMPIPEGIASGIARGAPLVASGLRNLLERAQKEAAPVAHQAVAIGEAVSIALDDGLDFAAFAETLTGGLVASIGAAVDAAAAEAAAKAAEGTGEIMSAVEQSLLRAGGMLDAAGVLGGVGSAAATRFQRETLGPLKAALDEATAQLDPASDSFLFGDALATLGFGGSALSTEEGWARLMRELPRLQLRARQGLLEGHEEQALRRVLSALSQRNDLQLEYERQQARLLELQEKQADLQFLQQQMRLLELIQENGLDAESILGGLQLGLDADAGTVMDAMARAMQELIARAEAELGINSPSRVFMEVGQHIMGGLAAGIERTREAARAMRRGLGEVIGAGTPLLSPTLQPVAIGAGGDSYSVTIDARGAERGVDRDIEAAIERVLRRKGQRADVTIRMRK